MTINQLISRNGRSSRARAMTLIEVLVSLVISSLCIAGIVTSYVCSMNSAQRFSLSLAATAQATERIEQIRGATWDSSTTPVIDQVVATNFPAQVVVLDWTGTGSAASYGTNYTQITSISTTPPVKRIRVDCVWIFGTTLMTNTIETCRAPDDL